MGTAVNALAEQYGDRRATWYFYASLSDLSVTGSTFTPPLPSISAKFVYSGKNTASVSAFSVTASMPNMPTGTNYTADYAISEQSWSNDSYKSLSRTYAYTPAQNTSTYFKSSNKTTRSITLTYTCTNAWAETHRVVSGTYYADWDGILQYGSIATVVTSTITLDVPPTVTLGTPTYTTPHYAGLGTYSVTVDEAKAYYGGNVQSITLTVGNDTVTQNYSSATVTNKTLSLTPSVAGTYTPTITVTDTRGQTKVENLPQIVVNPYLVPSINFNVQRCNNDGTLYAEGEYGLVTASITYTDAIAKLTQPTVAVRDEDGNLVVSSATWYTTWTSAGGVSSAVNWTNYNPTSPVTLYAIVSATGSTFSPNESFTVSITPTDNQGGVAETITQTLSTGFFTIDFQAGGKEIAFGAPASDDISNINGKDFSNIGLFKCKMGTNFNDMTSQEVEDFVDGLIMSGSGMADYVIEYGTEDFWTYRKWNSGIAECWGETGTITLTNYSTYGGFYGYYTQINFPSGLFISRPKSLQYTAYVGGGFALTGTNTNNTKDLTNLYALCSGSGSQQTIWKVHAIGNWK